MATTIRAAFSKGAALCHFWPPTLSSPDVEDALILSNSPRGAEGLSANPWDRSSPRVPRRMLLLRHAWTQADRRSTNDRRSTSHHPPTSCRDARISISAKRA